MIWARFMVDGEDYRPIRWPPPGPYWCTGHEVRGRMVDGELCDIKLKPIIVAYVDNDQQILEFWPGAENIEAEWRDEIVFTDRFAKPEWWTGPT